MRGVIPYTRYVIHTYTALHTRGARGELLAARGFGFSCFTCALHRGITDWKWKCRRASRAAATKSASRSLRDYVLNTMYCITF
jgi:hypothetical protein